MRAIFPRDPIHPGGVLATVKCRDCGGRVSKRAKTCPHCGAPMKKQVSSITGIGCLVIMLLFIFICMGIFNSLDFSMPPAEDSSYETSSAGSSGGERYAAHQIAKKLVPARLLAPQTADFPWDSVVSVPFDILVDGETVDGWLVDGDVHSDNALGVPIRNRWTVQIILNDGQFMPVRVSLEGDQLFPSN